jgi:hypothetical protein
MSSDGKFTMQRPRPTFPGRFLAFLALASFIQGCQTDPPGNPLPPASVITGAEFVYELFDNDRTGPRVLISGDKCGELRGLFDGSRIDREPAKWALLGELRLFLKGGGTEVYSIYSTGKGVGAYSDHLSRYFRGGSDAAFKKFLTDAKRVVPNP